MLLWQNFFVLQMLRLLYFVYQSIAIDTWLHKKKPWTIPRHVTDSINKYVVTMQR